jgi:hypothetical protein
MSAFTEAIQPTSPPVVLRALCVAVGVIVVVDALAVQAPGLALLAVPFLAAGLALRRAGRASSAALSVLAALYVAIGISFAASNGFDAGWGDLLFAYAGTPLALGVGLVAAVRFVQIQRSQRRVRLDSPAASI